MDPTVAIIIVNWNAQAYLTECLDSVLHQHYDNYKVMFVDNASTDGSVALVRERFPGVEIIELDKNYGFAKSNNIAMRKALADGADLIALLNNDTKADRLWIQALVSEMGSDKGIGMCASKMLRMDDPRFIDSTGHIFSDGLIRDRGCGELDRGQYDARRDVVGACAGAGLYRKEMLEKIGLFDERFVFWYEDAELSWRAYKAGWKARYVPEAIVYHKRGGTVALNSEAVKKEIEARSIVNCVRLVRLHASTGQRVRLSMIWIKEGLREVFQAVFFRKNNKTDYWKKLMVLWFGRL